MITPSVERAVFALQKRALAARDTYELDRIDRALDELLRNPTDTTASAKHRVRSAMGHAYEALERRKAIAPSAPLDAEQSDYGTRDGNYLVIEIREWLRTEPGLGEGERTVLNALANGGDAETLAALNRIPMTRMRERISRARRSAHKLWKDAVPAA
jgi:hypothetical protein